MPTPTPTPTPEPSPSPAPILKTGWLFLIKYIKTVDSGRVYLAYIDGEIRRINTGDKTARAVNVAYSYSMDGNLYNIGAHYNAKQIVGKVTLIDRKSIIVNDGTTGMEFSLDRDTVYVYVDGADSYTDASASVGDQVAVIYTNDRKAQAVFITKEYDDSIEIPDGKGPQANWLFLVNYLRTIDDGRVYNAIVGGRLTQIATNDKTVRPENTAYNYSMDGDLYSIDGPCAAKQIVGQVSFIDRKSIIVNDGGHGTEAKITNNTVTALLDGRDTDMDVSISKGDTVCLIMDDSSNAEGIFILEKYSGD